MQAHLLTDKDHTDHRRHHWSQAYSAVFAGGGVARGRVVGSTDALGGSVRETPVSPKDILATAFHLLGIENGEGGIRTPVTV